ncbi:hypothetical protein M3I54_31290 [Paraburkholderia sp. CNPSo 3274]|nr:hypothetical protein [Paraburkholderia sp. CNPSo 3274]MCP3711397.1 hypothetical protein [Paraburkholderia sp. CNPSo 3274]
MKFAIVVLDGVQATDVAGLLDVFSEANRLLSESRQNGPNPLPDNWRIDS